MQVPKIEKICINKGIGAAVADKKMIDVGLEEITSITGQKAVPTRSKKDISNFKLRKDQAIGVKVTLRGSKMYEFLDRLMNVALPRVRDFKGVSDKGFDRSEERRVGKECRSRWSRDHERKKKQE